MGEEQLDEQLVARVQTGDRRAFDLLVRRYQHKIVQLVERLVGEADALDVAQESFIKAFRAIKGFRGQSAFYTWLYRIAINTAKNHLASQGRRPAEGDLNPEDAEQYDISEELKDGATPERLMLKDEIERTVIEAIEELPGDLKMAITLRELEGLSYEEIAAAMDCPIGTVRSRIFRAREAINKRLEPLLD